MTTKDFSDTSMSTPEVLHYRVNQLETELRQFNETLGVARTTISAEQRLSLLLFLGTILVVASGFLGTAAWFAVTGIAENSAEAKAEEIATTVATRTAKTVSSADVVSQLLANDAFIETTLENMAEILPNAVIAFNGQCPSGWKAFEDLGGRFIIGAGKHSNRDQNDKVLTSYDLDAFGGAETHTLLPEELAAHSHDLKNLGLASGAGNTNNAVNIRSGSGTITAEGTGFVGKSKPHNNMPPYLALLYCIKE